MRILVVATLWCAILAPVRGVGQTNPKTLVAVWAHADDEVAASPVLARYAREGVRVHMIIATDGAQGGSNTSVPRGPELAKVRAEETACSAAALGARPPILLGFPDGALGHYAANPGLLYAVTERLHGELQKLGADAIVTWGPDGGTGHPDHRLVSSIVTQLVRAGAPGVPERLFYAYIPAEGFRAVNPARGAPPFVIPLERYFATRVSFTPADLEASHRAMRCHATQYPDEVLARTTGAMGALLKGQQAFVPAFAPAPANDLFQ